MTIDATFLLMLVAASSLLVGGAGRRWLGFRPGGLRAALGESAETVGLAVLLLVLNVFLGVTVSVLGRALGVFVSSYLTADPVLAVLSLLQALVVQAWRRPPSA